MTDDRLKKPKIFGLMEKISFLFFWLNFFYPRAKKVSVVYKLLYFFPQKILRINGRIPWPVHFTSKVLHPNMIEVGNNCLVGINIGGYVQGKGGIKIGNNFRMGPNVGIISANHDPVDFDLWVVDKPISIGNNVWVGMNSIIMPGVTIGDNVIIGSNSMVNSDIPSNCIAVGSPCRKIKEKPPYSGNSYK